MQFHQWKKEEEPLEREEEDHTKNQTRLFLLSKEKNSTCICDGGSDGRCWSQLHFNIQFVERKNPLLCFFLNAKHSTPKKVSGWLLYVCDLYFSLCKSSKDLRFLQ